MYKLDHYIKKPKKLRNALMNNQPLRPLSVKIKLTWQCNLACVFCSDWRIQGKPPPRPQYFDSWAKIKALLDELIYLKTKKVHFSGGEPLMFPWLVQSIDYLTQAGKHSSMVSNGTLWTPHMAKQIFEAGLGNITFSIDSPNESTFIDLRGRKNWRQLIQGIQNARKVVDDISRPIKIKSNTVITRENFRELIDLPRFAHELGIDRIRLLPVDDLHTAEQNLRLTEKEIIEFNESIAPVIFEKAYALGQVKSARSIYVYGRTEDSIQASVKGHYALGIYKDNLCFAPWLHSLVSADGRVFGCCMLKSEKIHIDTLSSNKSFETIWFGKEYSQFRHRMQTEKYPICDHCDDFIPENQYLNALSRSLAPMDQKTTLKPLPI